MRIYGLLFIMIWFVAAVSGQARDTAMQDSVPTYVIVDTPPEFPGGETALMKYISDGLQQTSPLKEQYPPSKYVIQFDIDTNGRPCNIYLVKPEAIEYREQLIAHIANMPPWKPGELAGEKVWVRLVIPIYIHWD